MKLPTFLKTALACPPSAGEGVHSYLYKTARHLHAHMSEEDIFGTLKWAVENCGREVPDREIWDAVRNSKDTAWGIRRNGSESQQSAWPRLNRVRTQQVIEKIDLDFDQLKARSPHPTRKNRRRLKTVSILESLFPDDPWICAGKTQSDFDTRRLNDWKSEGISESEFIVPSPMKRRLGRTKTGGKLSKHTLDNTGPRTFLVVEFDQGSLNDQASLVWELGRRAPLVMVVFSGSKSLHAWFSCVDVPEPELRKFMAYAVTLGADKATWTRSQFVRTPNVQRSNGNLQELLFFNPELI